MKKYAMIRDNIVRNIAVKEEGSVWNPSGYVLIEVTDIKCRIGDIWDGEQFITPEPTEPE